MTADDHAVMAVLRLLANRAPSATVCPSEVARSICDASGDYGAEEWRALMPVVHAAVDRLVTEGRLQLSWKGRTLPSRVGPYRIGRSDRGCPSTS